eukprot:TRINITY_DN19885_c0_g1_i2.p1 TRINITY_DN19885_c0_g1~~TRINITY_DN19885_c0_g1_i2.p1  ORF type:complete len:113 (-),score=12.34 TRINITY_DN19885_c0_g1_i2:47-385(-)
MWSPPPPLILSTDPPESSITVLQLDAQSPTTPPAAPPKRTLTTQLSGMTPRMAQPPSPPAELPLPPASISRESPALIHPAVLSPVHPLLSDNPHSASENWQPSAANLNASES